MNYQMMTDKAILHEIGSRLKILRLNNNISQENLALSVGLSRKTIQNAEDGKNCSLATVIAILRGLNCLHNLDSFLPQIGYSPMEMAKLNGKKRQRASSTTAYMVKEEEAEWSW